LDKCPEIFGVPSKKGCPKPSILKPIDEDFIIRCFPPPIQRTVYFNSEESILKESFKKKLDEVLEIMIDNKNIDKEFILEGHSDSQEKRNQKLSEKRAKKILNYLVYKGVNSKRLTSIGYGKEYPIADNNTKVGRAENRRVEIRLKK